MTVEEAIKKYSEKFGGFPYFLCMSMPDKNLIERIQKSLDSGEKIKAEKGKIY